MRKFELLVAPLLCQVFLLLLQEEQLLVVECVDVAVASDLGTALANLRLGLDLLIGLGIAGLAHLGDASYAYLFGVDESVLYLPRFLASLFGEAGPQELRELCGR